MIMVCESCRKEVKTDTYCDGEVYFDNQNNLCFKCPRCGRADCIIDSGDIVFKIQLL